jgi:hypothetical protein
MTVTLEDFAMITALPIQGQALTGRVDNNNWKERVTDLIGDCPATRDNRTSGVSLKWLQDNRSI